MERAHFEIKSVLYVNGDVEYHKKHTDYQPHLVTYQMVYKLAGENIVTFGDRQFCSAADTISILPKGEADGRYCVDTITRGDCIDVFFDCDERYCNTAFEINHPGAESLRKLFLQLSSIWSKKELGYYYRAMSVFYDILYRISAFSYIPGEKYDIIKPGVDYMNCHMFTKEISASELSGICGISYTYFSKLFESYFGQTPVRYINGAKLKRAEELLFLDKYTVESIAEMCGFDSSSYFCRLFKKHYKCTPSQYKESRKQKNTVD
jgi:AraC-like DNA-binding protein